MIPDSIHRRKVYKSLSSSTCFSFHKIFSPNKFKKKNVEWKSHGRNSLVYGPTKRKKHHKMFRKRKERKNRQMF